MDLYRHVLKLYPRSVREEYGDSMRALHRDLRVHGGQRGGRLFVTTVRDVIGSAPRLRWEEGMAHHPLRTRGIITILVALAFIGLAVAGPLLALPVFVALLVYMLRHRDDLDATGASATVWIGLPLSGAGLLLIGGIVASVVGDDSRWWLAAILPILVGSVTIVVSLVLMAVHEVRVRLMHQPELVTGRVRATGALLGILTLAVLAIATGESRGWAALMVVLVTPITLAFLAIYALLLHWTRPKATAAA